MCWAEVLGGGGDLQRGKEREEKVEDIRQEEETNGLNKITIEKAKELQPHFQRKKWTS